LRIVSDIATYMRSKTQNSLNQIWKAELKAKEAGAAGGLQHRSAAGNKTAF
jgi:hypothetical protein